MKLEKWKEKNPRKQAIIIVGIVFVLFITVIIIYRSFAFFEENQEFNVIKGSVPNQNYDLMLSFQMEDENGNLTLSNTIPSDHNYEVSITCNNGAIGKWNYEEWAPQIHNLTNTKTKCNFLFSTPKLLIDKIKDLKTTNDGTGIYEVNHNNANITYTNNIENINRLQETELRYVGPDPDNYILFNNEIWRIIGLLNTLEGQRIKLVRNESIGNYVWDSVSDEINWGIGINEWSQSKIKKLLNDGPYYNQTKGTCYIDRSNITEPCDFSNNGLSETSKNRIDTITWNTGTNGTIAQNTITTDAFYSYERSNNTGKICNSSSTGCNDQILRTTSWQGKVGLMYPSDYGYATIGNEEISREKCLETPLYHWEDVKGCYENNWIYQKKPQWLMTPAPDSEKLRATAAYYLYENGHVQGTHSAFGISIRPTIYLKTNLKVLRGSGTYQDPFLLID